ncbi:hypothetical protein V6N13_094126 [Hibiscus sabdariffa]
MTFRTHQGSNYGIGRGRVGEPAMAELSRIRHISCQPRFTCPGQRFPADTAGRRFPAMADLSKIRHIPASPDFPAEAEEFPPRPKIFRQAKAANCPARKANQSPAEIPAEAGLDKKYKVECDWIIIFF